MLLLLLLASRATALVDLTGNWAYLAGGIPGQLKFYTDSNGNWQGQTWYDSFSQYFNSPGPTQYATLSNIAQYDQWGTTYITFSIVKPSTTETYFGMFDLYLNSYTPNNFNGHYVDSSGNTYIFDATRAATTLHPPLTPFPIGGNGQNFSTLQNGWPGDLIFNLQLTTPGANPTWTAVIHDNSSPLPAVLNSQGAETMQNVKLYSNYYGRFVYYERHFGGSSMQTYFGLFTNNYQNAYNEVNGQFMSGSSAYAFNGALGTFGMGTGTTLNPGVLGHWYTILANGWAGYLIFWVNWGNNNQILGHIFFDNNRFDLNPTPPDPNSPEQLSNIQFLQTHYGYTVTFSRSNGQVYFGIFRGDFNTLRGHFTSGSGVYSFDAILSG